ncbi:unnamed protein product [Sympodiomycopsis kandeliae]
MTSGALSVPVPQELRGATETSTIKAHDGLELHYKRFSPPSSVPTVASVVFIHGFIDYIERYDEMLHLFSARGIELIAFDQRGFGNTAKNTSAAGFWKHYTHTSWPQQFKDVKTVVEEQRKWIDAKYASEKKIPLFILGHSMGGGISIALFTRPADSEQAKELQVLQDHVAGVVAAAPWLVLTKPPPNILKKIAPSLVNWFPNMKYPAGLDPSDMSRDPEVVKAWKNDPLVSQWVRLQSAWLPLAGGEKIVAEDYKYWPNEKPILIAHGEDDAITSHVASKQFIEKLNEKGANQAKYQGFPKGKHVMFLEIGDVKNQYTNAIIDWMLAQSNRENKL